MGHRAGQREGGREAGEGKKAHSLHPCAQPGERKKAERERERERKCLIYVLQRAARRLSVDGGGAAAAVLM